MFKQIVPSTDEIYQEIFPKAGFFQRAPRKEQ